ncbi:MAG TPA: hypothetical protein VGK93_03620 [Candidatus Eisenbacteria bacterium]|jgi:hypothetical protein
MSRKQVACTALVAPLLIVGLVVSAGAGGRARVTIDKVPSRIVAGQAFEVWFTVRPELGSRRNVEPVVRAVQGDRAVTVQPVARKANGRYAASIVLPGSGDWTITVDSRYCETRMAPLTVKAADKGEAS